MYISHVLFPLIRFLTCVFVSPYLVQYWPSVSNTWCDEEEKKYETIFYVEGHKTECEKKCWLTIFHLCECVNHTTSGCTCLCSRLSVIPDLPGSGFTLVWCLCRHGASACGVSLFDLFLSMSPWDFVVRPLAWNNTATWSVVGNTTLWLASEPVQR